LLDEGDFDLAKELTGYAASAARKVRKFVLFRQIKGIDEDIDSIIKEQQIYEKAKKALKEGVKVDLAKTVKGKFECFVLGDWRSGIELLGQGNDPDLKRLAEQTLPAMQGAGLSGLLADQWWEVSEEYTGRRERVIKKFAAKGYQDALSNLTGFQEKRAKSRILAVENLQLAKAQVHADEELKVEQPVHEANGKKRAARAKKGVKNRQEHTTFGQIKLSQQEIQLFINQCKVEKPKKLEELQASLNSSASRMTPEEIVHAKKAFQFVSNKNVLFVPRLRTTSYSSKIGSIFKPASGSYSARYPYADAEINRIIDKRSAYITFEHRGSVIVEGIDTSQLPAGRWQSFLLLKRVADRQVQGIVGQKSVLVYQAVSSEGFPKDVILW